MSMHLTARQAALYELLVHEPGLSRRSMAAELGVSASTISTCLHGLWRKGAVDWEPGKWRTTAATPVVGRCT